MNLRVVRAKAARKLQRAQQHEEHGGQNVRQRQGALAGEMRVELCRGIPGRAQSAGLQQNDGSPQGGHQPDNGEKDDRDPKQSHPRAIRIPGL